MSWTSLFTEYGPFGKASLFKQHEHTSYIYTMACPPVRGDNPRALASGLSYVQVDKHGITILWHLYQFRPDNEIVRAKVGNGGADMRILYLPILNMVK